MKMVAYVLFIILTLSKIIGSNATVSEKSGYYRWYVESTLLSNQKSDVATTSIQRCYVLYIRSFTTKVADDRQAHNQNLGNY